MQAELAAHCEHVHKLMLVGDIVASRMIKQLYSLRLLDLIGEIHGWRDGVGLGAYVFHR